MSTDTVAIEWECRRQFEQDRARVATLVARQRVTETALNAAVSLYIAHITAPWQGLADLIRSEIELERRI